MDLKSILIILVHIIAIMALLFTWSIPYRRQLKKIEKKISCVHLKEIDQEYEIGILKDKAEIMERQIQGSLDNTRQIEKLKERLESFNTLFREMEDYSSNLEELKFQMALLNLISNKLSKYKFTHLDPQDCWYSTEGSLKMNSNYKSLGNAYVNQGTKDQKVYEVYYMEKPPEEMK